MLTAPTSDSLQVDVKLWYMTIQDGAGEPENKQEDPADQLRFLDRWHVRLAGSGDERRDGEGASKQGSSHVKEPPRGLVNERSVYDADCDRSLHDRSRMERYCEFEVRFWLERMRPLGLEPRTYGLKVSPRLIFRGRRSLTESSSQREIEGPSVRPHLQRFVEFCRVGAPTRALRPWVLAWTSLAEHCEGNSEGHLMLPGRVAKQ
jgi:hypothetical protein